MLHILNILKLKVLNVLDVFYYTSKRNNCDTPAIICNTGDCWTREVRVGDTLSSEVRW